MSDASSVRRDGDPAAVPHADWVFGMLACPGCGSPIQPSPHGWECTACARSGLVDPVGVLHLEPWAHARAPAGQSDAGAREPATDLDSIVDAGSRDELSELLSASLSSLQQRHPGEVWRYLARFQANPYGYAVLGAVHRASASLVLGSDWGGLVRVVTAFGGSAIGVDAEYTGLFFSQLNSSGSTQRYARASARLPLPFRSARFDNVFLDGLPVAGPRAAPGAGPEGQMELLQECRRVLKPGGRLIVRARNRMSLWAPPREPDLAPWRDADAAPAGDAARWRDRGEAGRLRSGSRGRRGYTRLLRRAGFTEPAFHVLWPNRTNWHQLVPPAGQGRHSTLEVPARSWKQRLGGSLFRAARWLGLQTELVPDFCIVARAPADGASDGTRFRSSTLELILAELGLDPADPRRVTSLSNSQALAVTTADSFIKIPLTEQAEQRLLAECAALERLWTSGPAGVGLTDVAFRRVAGAPFVRYPLVRPSRADTWEDRIARLDLALQRLAVDTRTVRLHDTACWGRITAEETRRDLRLLGGEGVVDLILDLGSQRVPAGTVHGDLAWANVLWSENGELVLIDWDRYEPVAPKILDTVHACHSLARTYHYRTAPETPGSRLAMVAWELLLARDARLPLLHRMEASLGELSWAQSIAVVLLNGIERTLRATREDVTRQLAVQRTLERRVALLRRCLAG